MNSSFKILKHFERVDAHLHSVAVGFDYDQLFSIQAHTNYFERLSHSIANQQLSTKAAATIWQRFRDLAGTIEPTTILNLTPEQMRGVGLSNAKVRYIRGIAEAIDSKRINLNSLEDLTNEEVIEQLTQLKGVGVWTAEMFLMFTLNRPDIFSVGDLGLRRAMEKIYQLDNPPNDTLIKIAEKWSPYRTFACRILWESLDNNPTL